MIELLSIAYRTASREEIWSGSGTRLNTTSPVTAERFDEMKQRHDSLPRRRSVLQRFLGKAFGGGN